MKSIAFPVLLVALGACAHQQQSNSTYAASGISGTWHSGLAINSTDYRLQDCKYDPSGKFECKATDRGCASGNCETQSIIFSGIWSVQGTQLTRQLTEGWGTKEPKIWNIEGQDRGVLLFSGGERWFRSEEARNQSIYEAL